MSFLSHGVISYEFADGTRRRTAAVYNHETSTFQVKAGHGYQCPWTLGSHLAGHFGSGVVEMLFVPDKVNVHMPGDVELYSDRNGLWAMVDLGSMIRKMAPVHWSELRI